MIKQLCSMFMMVGVSLAAHSSLAQEAAPSSNQSTQMDSAEIVVPPSSLRPELSKAYGIVMLDYQVVPVSGNQSIDLIGFHLLNQMNDSLYLGVGGYAPLLNGEYGGFMAFDVNAHVQHKIVGNVFVDGGLSAGGGGGGKSVQHSKILSGTGGFYKGYLGLGYELKDFSFGVNVAKIKFINSAIDHSQLNLYFQVPFSYPLGSYASSGGALSPPVMSNMQADLTDSGENIMTIGLDNFSQIKPEGLNKGVINLADLQFSHFVSRNNYAFFGPGVGVRGLPLYNQVLGGFGRRVQLSPRVNVLGQIALGSGGYAPDTMNTGAGLLVYPKLSVEYLLDKNFGVALSGGYMLAPTGSSKNYTFGAALNYHIHSLPDDLGIDAAAGGFYRGYRINLFQQTETQVTFKNKARGEINLLSLQVDNLVDEYIYIPMQIAVAYSAYLGYPGYGELLTGVGLQNKFSKDSQHQVFGQLLVGTNVHGPILKYGVGLNYGLNDRLAIYGLAGQTLALDKVKFKTDYLGLGVTYRFSVPGW
ncbi:MAG: hypothetical protein HOO97_02480 [Sideroxydans sp.]|nr:hypothetical protein [Sideroxydans sp.]